MPSCRVTRPQDELISQKIGRRPIFSPQPHRKPLFVGARYLGLTRKSITPILKVIESDALSKKSGLMLGSAGSMKILAAALSQTN
jgi:hypothetical protein